MVVNIHPLCDWVDASHIAAVPNVTPVTHKEQLREKEIEREKEASQDFFKIEFMTLKNADF